jgi:hypothetical protein
MPRRARPAWIGAAFVAAGLTLAGCSGNSGTPTPPNPIAPTSSVAAAAPTSSAPAAKAGTIASVSAGHDFMVKAFPGLKCDEGMPDSSPNSFGHAAFLGVPQVTVITCGPPDAAYTMYLAPAGSKPDPNGGPVDRAQRIRTAWALGPNFAITSEKQSVHGLCSASVRSIPAIPEGLTVSTPGSFANTSPGPIMCPKTPAPPINTGADGHDLMSKAFPDLNCDQGMPVTPSPSTGAYAEESGGPNAAFKIFPTAKTVTLVTCSLRGLAHEPSVYLYIDPAGETPAGGGLGYESANGPNYVVVSGASSNLCKVAELPNRPDLQVTSNGLDVPC